MVGVHLVGGLVGTIGVGFLSTSTGLFYGGGAAQLVVQVLVVLVAMLWSGVATFIVASIVKAVVGLRVDEEDEIDGIDFAEHGESAYEIGPGSARRTVMVGGAGATSAAAPTAPDGVANDNEEVNA